MSNTLIIPQGKFYVYTLSRPITGVFYVGKGCGPRVHAHEREAKQGHECYKCNVIRKVWREGGEIEKAIVYITDDEQDALDYERNLIAHYGQMKLVNHQISGDVPAIAAAKAPYEMTDEEMLHYLDRFNLKSAARARKLEELRIIKIKYFNDKAKSLRAHGDRSEYAAARNEVVRLRRLCDRDSPPSRYKKIEWSK
jgi:hypothetical protein